MSDILRMGKCICHETQGQTVTSRFMFVSFSGVQSDSPGDSKTIKREKKGYWKQPKSEPRLE